MLGDIHICQFPFTSGQADKIRPALELFDLGRDVILCRVTSVMHSGLLDISLLDWRAAGLLKPSVVRLGRIVTAERTILVRRIGALSDADLSAIRTIWNQQMRL